MTTTTTTAWKLFKSGESLNLVSQEIVRTGDKVSSVNKYKLGDGRLFTETVELLGPPKHRVGRKT